MCLGTAHHTTAEQGNAVRSVLLSAIAGTLPSTIVAAILLSVAICTPVPTLHKAAL